MIVVVSVLQIALGGRLRPKRLCRRHHVRLLREERVAELLRPVELLAHHREHLRERRQRFHGRIPGFLLQRILERLVLEAGVDLDPALGLDDLQRIGGRHQNLYEELIGIERDRRHELLELLLRKRLALARLLR